MKVLADSLADIRKNVPVELVSGIYGGYVRKRSTGKMTLSWIF